MDSTETNVLDDRDPLSVEPMLNLFAVRLAVMDTRASTKKDFDGEIAKEVKEQPNALQKAQAWLTRAFSLDLQEHADPELCLQTRRDIIIGAIPLLRLYVHYYWLLYLDPYNKNRDERTRFLVKEMKKLGFGYYYVSAKSTIGKPQGTKSTKAKGKTKPVNTLVNERPLHDITRQGEPSTSVVGTMDCTETEVTKIDDPVSVHPQTGSSDPRLQSKPANRRRKRKQPKSETKLQQTIPVNEQGLKLEPNSSDETNLTKKLRRTISKQNIPSRSQPKRSATKHEDITLYAQRDHEYQHQRKTGIKVDAAHTSKPNSMNTHPESAPSVHKISKKKKQKRPSMKGASLDSHPAKKRRLNDSSMIPSDPQESSSQSGTTVDKPSDRLSKGKKRSRSTSLSISAVQTDSLQYIRPIAPLPISRVPKAESFSLPLPQLPVGTPTLTTMDAHICAAASVGLQQLRSGPPLVGTHWFYYDPTREYDDDDELLKAESGIEFDLHDHIQPPEPVENQQFIPSEDVQPPKCLWQILDLSKTPKKRITKSKSQLIPKPQGVAVQVKNEEHASSEVVYPKPPLERYPLIWSESRQEICETLDWFRSYQGGVYFSKDIAKGYLLSAFSAERDIFHHGGRLIISHGGGKADSIHSINGKSQFQEASDQTSNDKSVRSLLNTMTLQLPIVLLIDDKYRLFPFNLSSKKCTYAVLGFYRIAYAWAEKQPNPNNGTAIVKYKFAFQWCSEQGDPWWFSPSYSNTALPTAVIKQPGKICDVCNTSSPQIYAEGWMCLTSTCARFWCMGDIFAPLVLSYDEKILKPVQFATEGVPDIRPVHPTLFAKEDNITTTSQFCKGWHCLTCGRLSCRYKWEHWQCQNCDAIVTVEGRLRLANEFRNQTQGVRFLRHRTSEYSGIITPMSQQYQHEKGFAGYTTFILPCNRGRIHVIYSSPLGNTEADAILQKYQDQARTGHLRFRRWPLRAHKCRGTLLTNYFSQNTGEPYQYVGGAENTVPFTEDSAATDALRLIEKRMLQAINPPISANFNEVLSAAYMDKQKMAYHSDAERGLGPVVASLSLGASAYMHFRLHSQYSNEVPNPSARIVLSLFLRHGDVMVMEGANVQKYYEHTVVPLNFRFAATARSIDSSRHY